jgi:phosphotransferase system  glucose/maltose/N-acetylglucosamine-specific IIC component
MVKEIKQEFVADKAFIIRFSFMIIVFIICILAVYGLFFLVVYLINYYEDKKKEKEERKEKHKEA